MCIFCVLVSPYNNCQPTECDTCQVTIDILTKDVLLKIFDHYVDLTQKYYRIEAWCTLVHVCRKWQNIVLESPCHLNLQIHCHPIIPVREKLDIWPALPIALEQYNDGLQPEWDVDSIAAAFEQNNRVCQISLWVVPTPQMGETLATMHKP